MAAAALNDQIAPTLRIFNAGVAVVMAYRANVAAVVAMIPTAFAEYPIFFAARAEVEAAIICASIASTALFAEIGVGSAAGACFKANPAQGSVGFTFGACGALSHAVFIEAVFADIAVFFVA